MRFFKFVFLFFSLWIAGFSPTTLLAETVYSAHVEAELVSEVTSIQPGKPFWVALRMHMDPHWHTYWKNPGDSGLATHIEWTLPEGFSAGPIQWPYPERIVFSTLVVYGYEDEIFLLTKIDPPQNLTEGSIAELKASAAWLACEKVCIPGKGELKLQLPVKNEMPLANPQWIAGFTESKNKLPLKSEAWKILAFEDKNYLRLDISVPEWADYSMTDLYFFADEDRLVAHSLPQSFSKTSEGYTLVISKSKIAPEHTGRLTGILVSKQGWRGKNSERSLQMDIKTEAKALSFDSTALHSNLTLNFALFFAFIGGLILNLMPCVLPVLSIKILHLVNQSQKTKAHILRHGVMFTLGVLAAFWALAGLLLFLRQSGENIGWGFQLQSPLIVALLGCFFFLLALNLFGIFEVGASLTRFQQFKIQTGIFSDFLSGVLATVVATPCTAPFMGSALGFALTQPAPIALGVFSALGFGMAFPYLLLCIFPDFLRFLPKPGSWMIRLKIFLGFLLLATSIWLLWVLKIQTGQSSILPAAILSAILILSGAWLWGRHQKKGEKSSVFVFLLIFAGISLSVAATRWNILPFVSDGQKGSVQKGIDWEVYSAEKLEGLLKQDLPVFIDFTAVWCLSCQVNEKFALSNPRVVDKFKELGIIPLKADWTSKSDEVTNALASYGRSSIPVYVLYGRKTKEPVLLPELLTPDIVLRALEEAV